MTEEWVGTIALGVVAVVVIAAATILYLGRQRLLSAALREREVTIRQLTERFGSAAEFVAFASSPEAAPLFETLDGSTALIRRLLSLVGAALLLIALGIGFWINAASLGGETDINFIREAANERWWGTLCLASGVGLAAAAAASAWLGRRWGLIGR
jgi:hypothetical protein